MLISDIHLRDYHNYNKEPHQRLNSFVELAKDIVNIGKEHEIDTMLIGGDIVDKNTLSPLEIHALFNMFEELSKQFRIYSIIGNHDAKSKKEIDKEDTVITLLENFDNVSFHHQEILTIGNRKIAFENWVPKYDLSWIQEPVDIYMSHATIDYDQTGLYGMDTSVFDGKFTIGVFGDIHVTRQIDNLISIGNTKQESLSDQCQGGVMIMDLEDLSYERIPIDPEHKKYLHLVRTNDEEQEGWVDLDGEDMTYKIYKPSKSSGRPLELKLPKVTDIELKTLEVMKEQDLQDLHKEIKLESTYKPVDFNFNLNYLEIENFRSISNYKLDFSKDYTITGHTGSGKSSIITGLFYALVGNKKLKQEIKYGEDYCKLVVSLDYQGITYIITRGTGKGDFGLSVGGQDLKFATKLEFEKTVYEYLPFLNYHESYFFNYWDTELLSGLKVDRRYDLLSKYYRMDALSSYNDIGNIKFKQAKKNLKEAVGDLEKLQILLDSKSEELEKMRDHLRGKPKKAELEKSLEDHNSSLKISQEIEEKKLKLDKIKEDFKSLKDSRDKISDMVKMISERVSTKKSSQDIESEISSHNSFKELSERYTKGSEMLNLEKVNLEKLNTKLSAEKSKLDSLSGNSQGKISSEEDFKNIESMSSKFKSLTQEVNSLETTLSKDAINYEISLKNFEDKVKGAEDEFTEVRDHEHSRDCSECGQAISKEDLLLKIREKINSRKSDLEKFNSENLNTLSNIESEKSRLEKLKFEKDTLSKTLSELEYEKSRFLETKLERSNIEKSINELEVQIKSTEEKTNKIQERLTSINSDMTKFSELSQEELISLKSDLSNLKDLNLEKEKLSLEDSKIEDFKANNKSEMESLAESIKSLKTAKNGLKELSSSKFEEVVKLLQVHKRGVEVKQEFIDLENRIKTAEDSNKDLKTRCDDLDLYCQLTSRSGVILKSILEELTKTFSNESFKFTTAKVQANGKVITDMSVSYLVGKKWIPYSSLSSGQKTLCDLYYISKIVTGVGLVSFDETLRFLDDESLKTAVNLIDDIRKINLLISTHSSNLAMDGTSTLRCELKSNNTTEVELVV